MPTSALPAVASHNGGGGGGGAAASAAAAAAAAAWADSPALSRSGSETSGSDDNDVQQQQQRPATARRQRQDHDRSCGRCSSGTTSGPASAAALDDTVREEYGEHDARTMSPRRSTEEVDRMSDGARGLLIEYVPSVPGRYLLSCEDDADADADAELIL